MQHANHRPKFSLSCTSSMLGCKGYGCITVKYLGSSSPGGGVTARLGIVVRQTSRYGSQREYFGLQRKQQNLQDNWQDGYGVVRGARGLAVEVSSRFPFLDPLIPQTRPDRYLGAGFDDSLNF